MAPLNKSTASESSHGGLTHFDESGASRMVDVGEKDITRRIAKAQAIIVMRPETAQRIRSEEFAKGDVLEVARLAGIMASKRTADLIPLCHSLGLDSARLDFEFLDEQRLRVVATVSNHGRTGVEMEAMTAVSIAALTVYDMCKSIDRAITLESICLLEKNGGKSGHFVRRSELG